MDMYVWITVRVNINTEEGLVYQHQPLEHNRVTDLYHAVPVVMNVIVNQCHDHHIHTAIIK